jgi:hypothetical protein
LVTGGCHETIVENLVASRSRHSEKKSTTTKSDKDSETTSETNNENNASDSGEEIDVGSEFDFDSDVFDEESGETPILTSSGSTSRLIPSSKLSKK